MRGEKGVAMSDERGFTLLELAVVCLIIFVLAGIATPIYARIRSDANRSHSLSSLKNGASAAESWVVSTGGDYTAMTYQELAGEGYEDETGIVLDVKNVDVSGYCLVATNSKLPAGHDWRVATYDSSISAPTADDSCAVIRSGPVAARTSN